MTVGVSVRDWVWLFTMGEGLSQWESMFSEVSQRCRRKGSQEGLWWGTTYPGGKGTRPLGGYPGCCVGVEVGQEAWGGWLTPAWGEQWGSTSGWDEGRGQTVRAGGGDGDEIKTGEETWGSG